MSEEDSVELTFEPLTLEQLRASGAFLPTFDGVTIWRKDLQCEFCTSEFEADSRVIILQWQKRSDLHLMCADCFKQLLIRT